MKTTLQQLFNEYGAIEYRNGLYQLGSIECDRDRQKEIIKQVEALVRNEVLEKLVKQMESEAGTLPLGYEEVLTIITQLKQN